MGIVNVEPTTYITAAASENALVKANIIPVKIPAAAEGKITFEMACEVDEPKAKLASIKSLLTPLKLTSDTWNIVGMDIMDNTTDAEKIDHPNFKKMTMNENANSPYIIDGTEDNICEINLIRLIILVLLQ